MATAVGNPNVFTRAGVASYRGHRCLPTSESKVDDRHVD